MPYLVWNLWERGKAAQEDRVKYLFVCCVKIHATFAPAVGEKVVERANCEKCSFRIVYVVPQSWRDLVISVLLPSKVLWVRCHNEWGLGIFKSSTWYCAGFHFSCLLLQYISKEYQSKKNNGMRRKSERGRMRSPCRVWLWHSTSFTFILCTDQSFCIITIIDKLY